MKALFELLLMSGSAMLAFIGFATALKMISSMFDDK